MAHLIDTVFIVDRNKEITDARKASGLNLTDSWHTLGKAIDWDTTISADMIPELAGWTFEYDLIQGKYQDHNGDWQDMDRKAVVRRDNRVYLGDVGKGWTQFPFPEAVNAVRPWIESGMATPHTGGLLDEGRVSFLTLKPQVDPIEPVKGDPTELFLCFVQGHVGNLAATIGMTATRMVCWNTVSAGLRDSEAKVRIPHKKGIKAGVVMAAQSLDIARREFVATGEQMAAMAKFGVNRADLEKYFRIVAGIKDLTAKRADLHGNSRNLLEALDLALESAPGATVASGTLYAAYQAATYYNTHVRGRATADKRTQSLWTGELGRQNGIAWDAATGWMQAGSLIVPATAA
jgi:phage/plasmid-like protein (TIGR03299 family)